MTDAAEVYEAGALGLIARLDDGTEVRLEQALKDAGLTVLMKQDASAWYSAWQQVKNREQLERDVRDLEWQLDDLENEIEQRGGSVPL